MSIGTLTVPPESGSLRPTPEQRENLPRRLLAEAFLVASMGLRMTKEGIGMAVDTPSLEAAMAIENRNQTLASQNPNFIGGMAAFLEKRPRPIIPD